MSRHNREATLYIWIGLVPLALWFLSQPVGNQSRALMAVPAVAGGLLMAIGMVRLLRGPGAR